MVRSRTRACTVVWTGSPDLSVLRRSATDTVNEAAGALQGAYPPGAPAPQRYSRDSSLLLRRSLAHPRTPAIAYAFGVTFKTWITKSCTASALCLSPSKPVVPSPPVLMTCGRLHGSQTLDELDRMAFNRCCVGGVSAARWPYSRLVA